MADGVRSVNQYYGYWAQDHDDEFEPGSWAKGSEVYPGIVGFAQPSEFPGDRPGFGDFMQAIQSGDLAVFFPGLCVEN
jgi:hypothetical protein